MANSEPDTLCTPIHVDPFLCRATAWCYIRVLESIFWHGGRPKKYSTSVVLLNEAQKNRVSSVSKTLPGIEPGPQDKGDLSRYIPKIKMLCPCTNHCTIASFPSYYMLVLDGLW